MLSDEDVAAIAEGHEIVHKFDGQWSVTNEPTDLTPTQPFTPAGQGSTVSPVGLGAPAAGMGVPAIGRPEGEPCAL